MNNTSNTILPPGAAALDWHREVFSDKIRLNVLSLRHVEIATEEGERYGLVKWARYFNASTWEDLKMLVEEYPDMEKTVSEASRLSEEQIIREQMMLREEGIRIRRTEEAMLRKAQERAEKAEARAEKAEARADTAELKLSRVMKWLSDNDLAPEFVGVKRDGSF